MYCLDANVWVYYLDADLSEHEDVSPQVDALLATKPLFTTTVLQMEVVRYLANTLAESEDTVAEFLSLPDMTVADLSTEDVKSGADILHSHSNTGIGGRDATVLAAMERHGIDQLWTHDTAFAEVATKEGHTVHDPTEDRLPEYLNSVSGVDHGKR